MQRQSSNGDWASLLDESGARKLLLIQIRNVHFFCHMFTRPVFVFRTSWQHTERLMWNCQEVLAFDCERIWPDLEFWKHHVVDYFCGSSLQIKLCHSPFLPVCVCCAAFCRLVSAHPSLSFRYDLQLTSGAADLCVTELLRSVRESFKSSSAAANGQRSHSSHSFPPLLLCGSPTAL